MKHVFRAAVILAVVVASTSLAHAQTGVGPTKIRWVENGWFGEGIAIKTDAGLAGCPSAPSTEFAADVAHPNFESIVAIALTAFSTNADVLIYAQTGTCLFGGRTKILAIRILN